jgi:hypothetical protein
MEEEDPENPYPYRPGDAEEERKLIEADEDHNHPQHLCYSECYGWEDPEHGSGLHVCGPECLDWVNPDWPISCGDED